LDRRAGLHASKRSYSKKINELVHIKGRQRDILPKCLLLNWEKIAVNNITETTGEE